MICTSIFIKAALTCALAQPADDGRIGTPQAATLPGFKVLATFEERIGTVVGRPQDAARHHRVPSWEEVAYWELAFRVLRLVRPKDLVDPNNQVYFFSKALLEGRLRGEWHSAFTVEIARLVQHKYNALASNGEVPPVWDLILVPQCLDRRQIPIASRWLSSGTSSPQLLRLAARWVAGNRILNDGAAVWPWYRQEPYFICVMGHPTAGGRQLRDLSNAVLRTPAWPSALLATHAAREDTAPQRPAETVGPLPDSYVGLLFAAVVDPNQSLYVRYTTLDVLTRVHDEYDLQVLRKLALAEEEGLAPELLALGAVCALSRCPTKRALEVLAEVVERGQESARFQAASHLRYVAGLDVPPLIAWFDVEQQYHDEPWRSVRAWSDVARWLVDERLRAAVVRKLKAQIAQLPENWPGAKLYDLQPLFLHRHPGAWYVQQHGVPPIVRQRSKGEDIYWLPADADRAPSSQPGS